MWTLESKDIDFEPVDIADPNRAKQKNVMSQKVKERERRPLPPQIFNDEDYIGVSTKMSGAQRALYNHAWSVVRRASLSLSMSLSLHTSTSYRFEHGNFTFDTHMHLLLKICTSNI